MLNRTGSDRSRGRRQASGEPPARGHHAIARPPAAARHRRAEEALRDTERALIVVRTLGTVAVFAAVLLLRDEFPGYRAVLAGTVFILVYNWLLVMPLYRRSPRAARTVGVLLDTVTVAATSLAVAALERSAGARTDIWVCFFVLVAVNSLRFESRTALAFALFWSGWTVLYSAISGAAWGDSVIRFTVMLITAGAVFLVTEKLRVREELLAESKRTLEDQNRETLLMLAGVVEARDETTGQHLYRLERGVRLLALELGLPEEEAMQLGEAAVMHDVGKAGIPDRILLKPRSLTAAEWAVIKKHTLWGEAILGEREAFALARQVARSHHERWDGSGYPDGLKGEEIPLAARIAAVVDMYDALISRRPYKRAWPAGAAVKQLKRARGSQLDPRIVDAFVALLERGALPQGAEGEERAA